MHIPVRFKLLLFAVLIVFSVVILAETLVVKVQTTNLKKEPKFYAATVAVLKAGDSVESLSSQDGWFNVKTAKGLVGWLHSSAVQARKISLSATGKQVGTTASAGEVALAAKGFNKQVEDKYKADNKDVSFVWVDRMLKMKVTAQQILDFLKKGKLAEFGGPK